MIHHEVAEHMRRIGSKGGKARLDTMTNAERSAIARKASNARWRKPGAKKRAK